MRSASTSAEGVGSRAGWMDKRCSMWIVGPYSGRKGISDWGLISKDLGVILSKVMERRVQVCQDRVKHSQNVQCIDRLVFQDETRLQVT